MADKYRRSVPRTEERVFPPARRREDGMLREHRARYAMAASMLRGRVLDIGCGTGYGAHELALAPAIREVVAVDRSREAVDWAMRYYPNPKLTYRCGDVEANGWERGLGAFDGAVAFEVLEHLRGEAPFWRGIGHGLVPGGVLWFSTPLGRGRGFPAADPHHTHQLKRSEVVDLFAGDWNATYYGQSGTWIEPWTAGRRYYTIVVRATWCP